MMTPATPALHPQSIATAILSAPGWARVGITAPRGEMRVAAALALALARVIVEEAVADGLHDDRQYLLSL